MSVHVICAFRLFEVDQSVTGEIFVSYTYKIRNVTIQDRSSCEIRVALVLTAESVDADTLHEDERIRRQTTFLLGGSDEHQDEITACGPDGIRGSTCYLWGSTRGEHHEWITRYEFMIIRQYPSVNFSR